MVVVEHDLAVLDYLSDFICCLYGKPGAYGVVTMPFSVREVWLMPASGQSRSVSSTNAAAWPGCAESPVRVHLLLVQRALRVRGPCARFGSRFHNDLLHLRVQCLRSFCLVAGW